MKCSFIEGVQRERSECPWMERSWDWMYVWIVSGIFTEVFSLVMWRLIGVLLGMKMNCKYNERRRCASVTRGETLGIWDWHEESEETRGGRGVRRESNGDDGWREIVEGEKQKDSITNHDAGNRSFTFAYSWIHSLSGSPMNEVDLTSQPSVKHHNRNGNGFQPFQMLSDQSCNRNCVHCV